MSIEQISFVGHPRPAIVVLDQRALPHREIYQKLERVSDVVDAIKNLAVRGAPLLGIVGAYSVCIAIRESTGYNDLDSKLERIVNARPTAVNLGWGVRTVRAALPTTWNEDALFETACSTALQIHEDDKKMCKDIGIFSRDVIKRNSKILTICNTGALATGGQGTALSCFIENMDKNIEVFAMETRPLLQGARLTMYELSRLGIKGTLICDSAAAITMIEKDIDIVITGADRVAMNGDTANKIGTLQIAICARHYGVPFYIACPVSTIDKNTPDGAGIKIEERDAEEILGVLNGGQLRYKCYNPAFDVTPADLITGFITNKGIFQPLQVSTIAC